MRTLFFISFLLTAISLSSQNWIKIAEDDKNSAILIDKESMVVRNEFIYVWVQIEYNDDEYKSEYVDEYLSILKKYEFPNGIPQEELLKWIKFKYTLYYMIYDTKEKRSRTLSIVNFAQNGTILSKSDLDDSSKFEELEEGSLDELIVDELPNYIN
jgi:hypothetical protein